MKDTKLVRALETLHKEEWMSFRKYLLMNTKSDSEIFSLFKTLQLRKSNFENLRSPDGFRKKHYPHLTQKAFLSMQSKLYKWFEEWISFYEFKKEEYIDELYLVKALFRKGLDKEAVVHASKLKRKLEQEETLSFRTNELLGEIDHLIYYTKVRGRNKEEGHKLLRSASIKNANAYKDRAQFYIVELINRKRIYGEEFNETIELLEASIKSIESTPISEYGRILRELFELGKEEDLVYLQKALIGNTFKPKSELENNVLTYSMINSFRLHSSHGNLETDLMFDLINFQIKNEMEKGSGSFSQTKFHNTVDLIANMISLEKAKEFCDYWINFVETKMLRETHDLSYSQIYFIGRDFESMVKYSRFTGFDNYGQKTRSWLHNVICQFVFRKENYDVTLRSFSSFKSYLKRNKKKYSENFFQANFNLITIMEKLAKNDFKPQEIDISDYKVIFYRTWISEEVEKTKRK